MFKVRTFLKQIKLTPLVIEWEVSFVVGTTIFYTEEKGLYIFNIFNNYSSSLNCL